MQTYFKRQKTSQRLGETIKARHQLIQGTVTRLNNQDYQSEDAKKLPKKDNKSCDELAQSN